MSTYPYGNDYEQVQALGKRVQLKRFKDIQPQEDIILHDSRWWLVTGEKCSEMAFELEIAGPSGTGQPETARLAGDWSALIVTASVTSGLQFIDGALQDVPWPTFDLIYVRKARCRRGPWVDDEEVFGIFSLRYDADGDTYYVPVDRELQPGVASHWLLDPRYDLILDWEPVDVMDLLERMQGAGEDD